MLEKGVGSPKLVYKNVRILVGQKARTCRIDMKTLLLLASLFFATCFCPSLTADDQIKDASPDGKFGVLLTDKEEGGVKIQLIEVSSRKVVARSG